MWRSLSLLTALLIMSTSAFAQYRHATLQKGERPLPKKVIVLPADVVVQELSAGGVLEKVPEWARQSSSNLTRAMTEVGRGSNHFAILDTPNLTEDEQDKLDEAIATFMTVGTTAHNTLLWGGPAWQHKREEFDYTLGPGLAFLREKTGADAAILMAGDDVISSDGRKAAVVMAAMLGVGLPMGRSIALTSMVDLTTGDLLWMHYDESASKDLKNYDSVKEMVGTIFSKYPDQKK